MDERSQYLSYLVDAWKKPAPEKAAIRKEGDHVQLADAWGVADDDPRAAYIHRQQDAWKTSHP